MSREYSAGIEVPSYSDLRTYDTCPRLWYEQNITKDYEQPDEDYFIYGNLVDALLTDPEHVSSKFVRVDRRTKDETGMESVGKMQEIQAEIVALKADLDLKPNKIKEKTLKKKEIELKKQANLVKALRSNEKKVQVVNSIWKNAHETAECIKRNPLWVRVIEPAIEEGRIAFQLALHSPELNLKGTLDILIASKQLIVALQGYAGGIVSIDEVRKIGSDEDESAIIIDIKTCAQLTKFQTENTCEKYYSGQLAIYSALISNIAACQHEAYVLAGDKDPDRKMAQHYQFSGKTLADSFARICGVQDLFVKSMFAYDACKIREAFPAAKTLYGKNQTCFRCSVCREAPFSQTDEPVVI